MLKLERSAQFKRDYKRLKRRHRDMEQLHRVMRPVAEDTPSARRELKRRHGMHALRGKWGDSHECHVATPATG